MFKNKIIISAAVFFLLSVLAISSSAAEAEYTDSSFTVSGFDSPESIYDGNRETYSAVSGEGSVTVTRQDGIYGIYVVHDTLPQEWYITDPSSGETVTCAVNGFLHEYIDIEASFGKAPEKLVLKFSSAASVCDIYAFSDGELPDFVQVWEKPLERADLMLVSSHSDDEQLFFAGILPYYAGERGLDVQVLYMVQHYELYGEINHQRPHEQLDGLWAVGIRNYPVISDFPDLYAENTNPETALAEAQEVFGQAGVTFDDFVTYLTDNIRKFKPLVVVSHDFNGEYGHGTHVMCAKALSKAIMLAADSSYDTESAIKYGGAWCVEKLYIHLYGENKITLDLDTPLEAFDGKTAFEMTQYGFSFHKSQHWTWFNEWLYGTAENPITKASQIKDYSPCEYGLYFSNVGLDTVGGDFFENVKTYAEMEAASNTDSVLDSIEAPATLRVETSAPPVTEEESASETEVGEVADNSTLIAIIVMVSVAVCIALAVFISYSSINASRRRNRRRNMRRR